MDLLDFSLYNVLSISSHPSTGIPTSKKINNSYPKVALYNKIYPTIYKKECLISIETTALNICIISKIINILHAEHRLNEPDCNYIVGHMHLLLEYQIHYCIENANPHHMHISELAALMEACLYILKLLKLDIPIEGITMNKMLTWFQKLKSSLTKSIKRGGCSIYELSCAARALYSFNKNTTRYEQDEVITIILLELIERRNSLGLLHISPLDRRIAPISHHFFVMETLLKGYSQVQLDNIYEEAFELFNRIYRSYYDYNSGYFSFQKGPNIRYTAEDLGLIISALNILATWADGENNQTKSLINKNSYMSIIASFMEEHDKIIYGLEYIVTHSNRKYPIFPSRLTIKPPYPTINWIESRGKDLKAILHLCNRLLDIYEIKDNHNTSSHMDVFAELLLRILG